MASIRSHLCVASSLGGLMLESWIEENQVNEIDSAEYWNKEEKEAGKAFYVLDGFEKLEEKQHLKDIYNDINEMLRESNIEIRGNILSLASGSCWLESWLLKDKSFQSFIGVDISKHRIHKLAPITVQKYGLPKNKTRLVHGDIHELSIEDSSQDIVILCQAFHHTDQPIRLLRELKRVLKEDGRVLVVGEHYYGFKVYFKRIVRHFLRYFKNKDYRKINGFLPQYESLFPPCFEKGDNHYSPIIYHNFFTKLGFQYKKHFNPTRGTQGFILSKEKLN